MALVTTTAATAQSNCNDVVRHCNHLLEESADLRAHQQRIIDLQKEELSLVQQNLQIANKAWAEEKGRAEAWYRDPFIVIPSALLIGFIGGMSLGRK